MRINVGVTSYASSNNPLTGDPISVTIYTDVTLRTGSGIAGYVTSTSSGNANANASNASAANTNANANSNYNGNTNTNTNSNSNGNGRQGRSSHAHAFYPVLVHRLARLLHASSRPRLAVVALALR